MSRDKNRAEFPGLAALVDEVRRHFPEAKLLHGEEGGREVGKRPADLGEGIDLMKPCLMEADFSVMRKGKRNA